jgi:hypothetical protein
MRHVPSQFSKRPVRVGWFVMGLYQFHSISFHFLLAMDKVAIENEPERSPIIMNDAELH